MNLVLFIHSFIQVERDTWSNWVLHHLDLSMNTTDEEEGGEGGRGREGKIVGEGK